MTDPDAQTSATDTATAPRQLHAGAARALLAAGDLRYLGVGATEMVRRVYVAVRDTAWDTIEPVLDNVRVGSDPSGFTVTYDARHVRGDIDFEWRASLRGAGGAGPGGVPEARVTFEMDGQARTTFRTSRTGLCVLHPLRGCVGEPCVIGHADGTRTPSQFPVRIRPDSPFTDIRSMSQEFAGGLQLKIEFAGEDFETEDQRNWADGSFKTYCRPLRRPFPYVLERGQRVRQSVTMTFVGAEAGAAAQQSLRLGTGDGTRLPGLGLRSSFRGRPLTAVEQSRLEALRLSHLRVDVRLADNGWRHALAEAAHDSARLAIPLEIAVHVAGANDLQLALLAEAAARLSVRACRWIVYEAGRPMPSAEVVAQARHHLGAAEGAPVGAGTLGNFAEVNRNRPDAGTTRLLAYPINPQLHATDDLTLIENLEAHGDTVDAARSIVPDAQVCVSPVTLHRLPDPFAAGKQSGGRSAEPDARQRTMLGAAWTLGSIASLAQCPPDSVTFYDVCGPFGVMDPHGGFPLYRVLADVGEMDGADAAALSGFDRLQMAALAMRKGARLRLLLASFGTDRVVPLVGFDSYTMKSLRVMTAEEAADGSRSPRDMMADASGRGPGTLPLELAVPASAYLCVDFEMKGSVPG